jgi:hypothetical protein
VAKMGLEKRKTSLSLMEVFNIAFRARIVQHFLQQAAVQTIP